MGLGHLDHMVGVFLADRVERLRPPAVGVTDLVADGANRLEDGHVERREEAVIAASPDEAGERVFVRVERPAPLRADRLERTLEGRTGVLPVRTSIEPSLWADIVWCSERIRAILSPSPAWSGKSSQRSMPGTGDGMGRKGPRYASGASGLGS